MDERAGFCETVPRATKPDRFHARHAGETLKAVFAKTENVGAFIALISEDGVTPADCEIVAVILRNRRCAEDALAWVERGLALKEESRFTGLGGCKLGALHREILRGLGREEDALAAAWKAFAAAPGETKYAELMAEVPEEDVPRWHARALDRAEEQGLAAFITIAAQTNEWERLAARVLASAAAELRELSHYTTEPAAEGLAASHAGAAARLFEAMAMRIVTAGKSKYYDAALKNLVSAKRCFEAAGEPHLWEAVVLAVRKAHRRKVGLLPGFERIVRGELERPMPPSRPTFLEAAKARWKARTGGA